MRKLFKKFVLKWRIKESIETVTSKNYFIDRLDTMNTNIKYWKRRYSECPNRKGKEYCFYMLNMYIKRYVYYANKLGNYEL